MAQQGDTEITLGTGTLLGIFFGLVVLCSIFFALGYSLGRSAAAPQVSQTEQATPPLAPGSHGNKPGASAKGATTPNPADCASKPEGCPQQAQAGSSSDELTFYKSVEQKDAANAKLTPAANTKPVETSPAQQEPAAAKAPELKTTAGGASGYLVQVAAVSKQEDADALVSALRKKQYPVFVMSNSPSDRLFRVQVGPFAELKDAESMRQRLVADGYNAMLKK